MYESFLLDSSLDRVSRYWLLDTFFLILGFGPNTGVKVEIFNHIQRQLQVFNKFACQFDVEYSAEEFRLKPVFIAGDGDVDFAADERKVNFSTCLVFELHYAAH